MPAHEDTYGRFYNHPQPQGDGSFKDVVYVEVMIKGNKNTSFSRPVTEEDKTNWPRAWSAFRNNSPEMTDGNPVSVLPGLGPSQVMNLQALGILSVEDLAEMSDNACDEFMGGLTMRNRAKAYLAAMKAEVVKDKIEEPVDLDELGKDPDVVPMAPKKRGPKPKNREAALAD
jgi:hypothetical protein